jgi:hypothetical protein
VLAQLTTHTLDRVLSAHRQRLAQQ